MEMTIPIVCIGSCSANVCPHTFGKEGVFQLHLKTEKRVIASSRPAAHVLSSSLCTIGLFARPQTQKERNMIRFSAALCGKEHRVTTLKTALQQTMIIAD